MDETPIKVQDRDKKSSCHLGYYWVYNSPVQKTVLISYAPTRSDSAPRPMLEHFNGYLQTDGYVVYENYARSKQVTHAACWAHARRELERTLDNDRTRAEKALSFIQKLYAVERKAQQQGLFADQIKALRLEESLPIINEFGKWIAEELHHILPKSRIGKAMAYSLNRWKALCIYLHEGNLKIDNKEVGNTIRPIALGRKNYLFAGSHQAAQRASMISSFFATCKKHEVSPFDWLKHTLENIMDINQKHLESLFPQNHKINCSS